MEKNESIRIIVAYEHLDDGMRARKMLDRIAGELEAGCSVESGFWDFARMADRSANNDAATAVKEADMIIMATRNGLPDHVRDWLEQWASRERTKPVSIVVMRGREQRTEDLPALLAYLQELATRGGADFFWHDQHSETEEEGSLEKTPRWLQPDILRRRYEISDHRQ